MQHTRPRHAAHIRYRPEAHFAGRLQLYAAMKSRSVSIPSQIAISILLRSSTRPPQQPCPQAGNISTFLRTTAQSTSRNGPCHARRRIARSPPMPQQPHAVCNLRQSPDVQSTAETLSRSRLRRAALEGNGPCADSRRTADRAPADERPIGSHECASNWSSLSNTSGKRENSLVHILGR